MVQPIFAFMTHGEQDEIVVLISWFVNDFIQYFIVFTILQILQLALHCKLDIIFTNIINYETIHHQCF